MKPFLALLTLIAALVQSPFAAAAPPSPASTAASDSSGSHDDAANAPSPPELLPAAPKLRPIVLADGRLKCFVNDPQGVASTFSTDGGRTWTAPRHEFDLPQRLGLSLTLLDHAGEAHLVFLHGRGEGRPAETRFIDLWHSRSHDRQTAWSTPKRIWEGYCGAVLDVRQLFNGRIIIPFAAWKRPGEVIAPDSGSNYTTAVYSDDRGQTWQQSTARLTSPCVPNFNGNNYGAIEPTILQLRDDQIWMLLRTQAGSLYESFSKDGADWSPAEPTRFASSTSPACLVRLPDQAIVLFWNNCEMPPKVDGAGVYGGRDALHAAISRDNGQTWRGFREVYRDPFRNQTPPRRGDRGTAYPVAVACPDGSVHLVTGQGNRRTAIRVDPRWLELSSDRDDFSRGLEGWHVWTPFGPASGYWRDRTHGARLVPHPDQSQSQVLHVRRQAGTAPDCAIWNFAAGESGSLALRLRLNPDFAGAELCLADRFFDPDDPCGSTHAALRLPISADGSVGGKASLGIGPWRTLHLAWDLGAKKCRLSIDNQPVADLPIDKAPINGISYLRIRSTAADIDTAGLWLASVEATGTF